MDGSINGWFTVQPDQMQTINPVLCLIFIPIFESAIYPFFHKIRLIRTPLQKLSWGGILAAVAFLISGFLELQIEVISIHVLILLKPFFFLLLLILC